MDSYRIQAQTLTDIADCTRNLAQTDEMLTPEDIIYWLGRVKAVGQAQVQVATDIGWFQLTVSAVGVVV